MIFAEFKSALRSHEESAKTLDTKNANENVMFAKQKFDGNCFKCGRKGHKSSECLSKIEKWCSNCRNKSHETKNQLQCPDGTTFGIEQKGRLHYLNSISSSKNSACSLNEWHKIMGHCNYGDLRRLEGVVDGMRVTNYEEIECMLCTEGKMCQMRNKTPDVRAKAPLDFVHCDLAGPIDPTGRDGFRYALSFVDDFSGIIMIYFLKSKSDAREALQQFLADCAPLRKVKRLRSDNGTEFMSQHFQSILRENNVRHETSAPYSPHQNGTVERAWLSLFNMARCLLLEAKLQKSM